MNSFCFDLTNHSNLTHQPEYSNIMSLQLSDDISIAGSHSGALLLIVYELCDLRLGRE